MSTTNSINYADTECWIYGTSGDTMGESRRAEIAAAHQAWMDAQADFEASSPKFAVPSLERDRLNAAHAKFYAVRGWM